MKSGIQLITKERKEQIKKHNRSVEEDVLLNTRLQLPMGAVALIEKDWTFNGDKRTPEGWDFKIWNKMHNKSYKERLIIAGALIAAEIDRIQRLAT
jgi:hypothetical protein